MLSEICHKIGDFHRNHSGHLDVAYASFKESVSEDEGFLRGRLSVAEVLFDQKEYDRG